MKKYNVGFTAGVFDLFHVGHLNLFENCKKMCSHLIVGVCDDEYVRDIKHKEPIFPLEERVRIISSLKCVDEVVVVSFEEIDDKMLALEKFKFDVLFSGDDWKGSERYLKTEEQFSKVGVSIEYLPYTKSVSTTEIKNKIKSFEG
ncbi:MAG: adenylyltransferase/cytidyltransferase family protein [Clostridia bacterium]|nr:adenylyltransferase/cytidyltransferase family protein [Clostridia bacterium]